MAATIDRLRFVRVSWFFLRAFIAVAIRDVLCDRPGLRWLKGDPDRRWHAWALEFRALALRLGGVLIKLGQFLSTRVDILPLTITEPLADLQDEVPAAPFGDVVAGIERELGAPISSVFEHLEERPLGAASLAQAHAAVLPGGERVVLKVLRPGIERIVETDLAAIGRGILWLGVFQAVRRRVDLGRLGEEFARVTRLELDLQHEGQNAELFAAAFAEDDGVIVPRVEWRWSRRRLLALQDVGAIRSADTAALVAAGIDPGEVAREINRLFLEQVFVHHLVHCDPHPGNLFIHPVRDGSARTFRVALVDFGMVVEVPEALRQALRDYLVGLGTRDAPRVVKAFRDAGVLLPGADLKRIEQVHDDLLERFWGVPLGELQDAALGQLDALWDEYRDLLRELPFQVPIDLLFVGRAAGLTSGLATRLDPKFDPWSEVVPFARRLEEGGEGVRAAANLVVEQVQLAWSLPRRLDRLVGDGLRGRLRVEAAMAPETRRAVDRIELALARLGWTVLATGALVTAALGPTELRLWAGGSGVAMLAVAWFRR